MVGVARCSVDAFERGRLPPVCAVTGRPADGWYTDTYESRPGALYVLLLFGLVPYPVVRALTRKTATGRIPVTGETFAVVHARARARRRRTVTLLGIGGGVALVGIALLGAAPDVGPLLAVVGLMVMAVGIALDRRPLFLAGHVEPPGRWVVIEDAHPAFAAALDARTGGG